MALTACPQCGQTVSDRAACCPHCGCEINPVVQARPCLECGTLCGGAVCPVCGCPQDGGETEESVESAARQGRKRHRGIAAAVIIAAAFAVGALGAWAICERRAADYSARLEAVTYQILSGSVAAEEAGNLVNRVWHNAIYEEYDETTDPYTLEDGTFTDDFNRALDRLLDSDEYQERLTVIRESREEVAALMQQLRNPPGKYQEAYAALKVYYEAYLDFTWMAMQPAGSLRSFAEEFDRADAALLNAYEAMRQYLA